MTTIPAFFFARYDSYAIHAKILKDSDVWQFNFGLRNLKTANRI